MKRPMRAGLDIYTIEKRFKQVAGLQHLDLSTPHFQRADNQQQKTTKEEYKKFGFVTTPLWLVDEMLEPQIPSLTLDTQTCDACAGCGQFSIRLMRKFYNKLVSLGVPEDKADIIIVNHWLKKNHWFTEFQFSNIAKLVYIFGPDINVYAGDSLNLKHSGDSESGILFYSPKQKKWVNLPKLREMLEPIKDDLTALLVLFEALESRLKVP